MKVILRKNHGPIGHGGDVVNVKRGYFRNYLQPQGIAIPYSAKAAKLITSLREKGLKELNAEKEKNLQVKDAVEKLELVFARKTAESGKLFGSITQTDVAKMLQEKGFDINKKQVKMEEHLKVVGAYTVDVDLFHDVTAKVRILIQES